MSYNVRCYRCHKKFVSQYPTEKICVQCKSELKHLEQHNKLKPVKEMPRLGDERSESPDIKILEDTYDEMAKKKNERTAVINQTIKRIKKTVEVEKLY